MDIRRLQSFFLSLPEEEKTRRDGVLGSFLFQLTGSALFCGWSPDSPAVWCGSLAGRQPDAELAARMESLCQQAAQEQAAQVLRPANNQELVMLASPCPDGRGMGLLLRLPAGEQVEPYLVILQLVAVQGATVSSPSPDPLWAWWQQVMRREPSTTAGQALADAVAISFSGCDAAVVVRGLTGWHLAGATGSQSWPSRSPLRHRLLAAAQEAARAGRSLDNTDPAAPAHASVNHLTGSPVRSHPLHDESGGCEAVLLLWGEQVGSADSWTPTPLAGMVVGQLVGSGLRAWIKKRIPASHEHHPRRWLRLALWVAVLLAIPLPHPSWVNFEIEPIEKRVIAAPFDATLARSMVRPSDKVHRDQVLATLDDREWLLRQAGARAAHERARKMSEQALTHAQEDPSAAIAARLDADQLEWELRQIDFKVAHLQILSPLDGSVIEGDLDRAAGVPVKQGQTLFVVAPLDKVYVRLEFSQQQIGRVRLGDPVWARLGSRPFELWKSHVERVLPSGEQLGAHTIFRGEAPLDSRGLLRPGETGTAIVWGGWRPLGWILFHRVAAFFWTLGW